MSVKVDTVLMEFFRRTDGMEWAIVRIWVVTEKGKVFWYTQQCLIENGRIMEYFGEPTTHVVEHVIPQEKPVLDQSLPHRVIDSLNVSDLPVYKTVARELERIRDNPAVWQYLLAYNPMLG